MIVVINKCDNKIIKDNEYEFYELGFQNYLKVSGEQGNNIYDLLESIKNNFHKYQEDDDSNILFSIIGRQKFVKKV